jgi:hypothetical protein
LHVAVRRREFGRDREPAVAADAPKPKWSQLLRLRQTWGIIAARASSDPVWFFIADWFMLFLVQQKGFDPKNTLVAIWVPFIAADLGNFAGGGISSWPACPPCRAAGVTIGRTCPFSFSGGRLANRSREIVGRPEPACTGGCTCGMGAGTSALTSALTSG